MTTREAEQLFTRKLGGRKPTHSTHFAQMGSSIVFRYFVAYLKMR